MSHIERMIAELCPDGVEFVPLNAITLKPSRVQWGLTDQATRRYIDLSSVDLVTRQITSTETIDKETAPSRAQQIVYEGDVLFATTRPTQMRLITISSDFHNAVASTGYCVLRPDQQKVKTNYLLHALSSADFNQYVGLKQTPGNYPSIPDRLVRAYEIPLPPMEVQREIVRILDNFSQLEAELEAELEARRKQYEFYRDRLLTFDDPEGLGTTQRKPLLYLSKQNLKSSSQLTDETLLTSHDTKPIKYVALKEVARIRNGKSHKELGIGTIPVYGSGGVMTYVDTKAHPGPSVLIPRKGSLTNIYYVDEPFWTVDTIFYTEISELINPKFFYYYLITLRLHNLNQAGGVPSLTQAILNEIPIPLPPLEEQERIVEILDKFDALVNDLSIGLPAELQARRKQYEYYRDRLLTFDELSA